MGKKELVPNPQYTDEFKVEAVRLGESIGHSGFETVEFMNRSCIALSQL